MDEQSCDCCEGIEVLTPVAITNRPGLSALAYRVGTHARFFETMKAKLSSQIVEVPRADDATQSDNVYPLRNLATRASDDPSIALLDGWATVADVLTFYQQRIANEGYLRTATERRSILELARLVGYSLRPGVASTVYLAYTIDPNHKVPTEIPIGSRSQSVPNPGELPQSFETSEVLDARASWNTLKPRMSRPQTARNIRRGQLYLAGINTNLKPGDPLLIDFGSTNELYRILRVDVDAAADRTRLELENWYQPATTQRLVRQASLQDVAERYSRVEDFKVSRTGDIASEALTHLENLKTADAAAAAEIHTRLSGLLNIAEKNPRATRLQQWLRAAVSELSGTFEVAAETASFEETAVLSRFEPPDDPLRATLSRITARPSVPPRNTLLLDRKIDRLFPPAAGDAGLQVLGVFNSEHARVFPLALANTQVAPDTTIKVYALRQKASLFGYNAPPRPDHLDTGRQIVVTSEWTITNPLNQTKPVALFYPYPVTGVAPLTVHFIDFSSGDIQTWEWNFGDGQTSSIRSPVHQFAVAKTYIVTLTVTGAAGQDSAQTAIYVSGEIGLEISASARIAALEPVPTYHQSNVIFLDAEYNIAPQSWVVIIKPDNSEPLRYMPADKTVTQQSLAAYGLAGKSTRIDLLHDKWIDDPTTEPFSTVRGTSVYAQSEELMLAQMPIDDDICQGAGDSDSDWLELDDLYTDLKSGRWLVVSGERADVVDANTQKVRGVEASELVMLTEVIQDVATELVTRGSAEVSLPYYYESKRARGQNEPPVPPPLATDKVHTWIRLAKKLEYCYLRDKVTIYGNVVKATNGETRSEVLGSGDGSRALQSFDLKQPPLTYVAAPNPSGVDSTLRVYGNDVEWHEAADFVGLGRTDHQFITRTNDEGKTTVIFGNGQRGSRLPTGTANVRAVYRNGIGKAGNVQAKQISLLVSRPLGVKEVINPLRASGAADKETRDQARKNAPLMVTALDRLVSVQDYTDFTRTFAGIAKAAARRMSDGERELVHVTIAGVDDAPIDPSSDLYRNLLKALRDYGDPDLPVKVDMRELLLLVISAKIYLQADYVWEKVVSEVRAQLLDAFSFDRRELGQDAMLSEVLAVMQAVRGVAYVDVDVFDAISEKVTDVGVRRLRTPKEITDLVHGMTPPPCDRVPVDLADNPGDVLHAAQLAFLSPLVLDTLILNRG